MNRTPALPATATPALLRRAGWAGLLLATLLAGCGGGRAPVAEALPAGAGEWTKLIPRPTEIDGTLLTASCSRAPGANAAFHFWARRGSTNKLVVFFEGGGACWDSATCSLPITANSQPGAPGLYKAEILPSDDPTRLSGIFAVGDARNPLKDWSMVYVPYCTGDIHSGSKSTGYTSIVNGQPFTIEHRGADNFRLILRWMRDNFDSSTEQILVTGSSAGGYGAVTHFPAVREAWPGARAAMLDDAGQGVAPASFQAPRNTNWNFQLSAAVYGANPQDTTTSEIVKRLADKYPNDRFAQYTTATDLVQMQFYDIQVNGLTGTQGTACTGWINGMLAGLQVNQQASNFRSYLAAGTSHTILRGTSPDAAGVPLFFRETSAGGTPFTDWLAALVATPSTGFVTRSCSNCTALPVACPFSASNDVAAR